MANRYWVGGSGTWDSSSTTNWAASSGGAAGASAPTSVDDVFFDASSGSPTVYMSGAFCRAFSHAAGNATFSGAVQIYGGLTFSAGTTIDFFTAFLFQATSGTFTVNTAGRDLNQATFGFGPGSVSTATWTLGSALTNVYSLSVGSGTFSTSASNYGITGGVSSSFNFGNAGYPATINLNGSTIGSNLVPFAIVQFYTSTPNLLTLNLGTSTIYAYSVQLGDYSNNAPSQYCTITSSAGQSFRSSNSVYGSNSFTCRGGSNISLKAIEDFELVTIESFTGTIAATSIVLRGNSANPGGGAFTAGNSGFTGAVSISSIGFASLDYASVYIQSGTFTCSGAITLPSTNSINSSLFYEAANSTTAITVGGTLTTVLLELYGTGSGVASFATITLPATFPQQPANGFTFARTGNTTTGNIVSNYISSNGGNVTMGTVTTRTATSGIYTNGGGYLNHSSGNFSCTSFSAGASAPRWSIFSSSSGNFSTGSVAGYTISAIVGGTITLGAVTLADDSFQLAGNTTLGTPSTAAITSLTASSTSSNLIVNPVFPSGYTGTITFSGAINIGGGVGVDGGSLVLGTSLTATNLGVYSATINFVSATVSLTNQMDVAAATVVSTAPSITFNPPAGVIFYFYHGGKTFTGATITANGTQVNFYSNTGPLTFTCANFTRTGAANVYSYLALSYTNITCTGTVTLSGNSLTNRIFVYGTGSISTITASTRSLTNVDLRNITGAGGSLPWGAGTSVGDVGNNTNITFTPAVTRYARGSGAWDSTTVWSATSGGATGATVPLAQDDVQFNSGSGAVNVTTGTRRFLGRNISISNFTGTFTVNTLTASTNQIKYNQVLGNLTLDSSATIASSDGSGLFFTNAATNSVTVINNITAAFAFAPTVSTSLNIGGSQLNAISVVGTVSLACTGGTIKSISGSFDGTVDDVYYFPGLSSAPNLNLSATSVLNTNYIDIFNITPGASTVNYILDVAYPYAVGGTFYDLVVINTTISSTPQINFNSVITNSLTTTPSTLNVLFTGSVTCNGNGRFTPGTFTVPVRIGQASGISTNFTLTNNTSFPQETQYAYYANSTVVGSNPQLRAFGATNVKNNTGITFPTQLKVAAFTNFTGSWQVPNDFGGTYQIFAVGGGGQAAVQSSGSVRGSGGGGSGGLGVTYGISGVQRKSTIYISAASATGKRTVSGSGIAGGSSWLNVASNTIPSSNSTGAVGTGGNPSSNINTSGGGSVNGLGVLTVNGGIGGSSSSTTTSAGGGGGALAYFTYGQINTFLNVGGSSAAAGRGGGGGCGAQSSGFNGLSTGGGNGGNLNGGLGGTNSPALDGNNGGLIGGGGGGGGGITKSGGNGGGSADWTYNYLNGVAASGTIGVGGGGGGAGYQSGATRVIGGDGEIGAGGGGVGYYSSGTNPYGGSGGAGLVLFVYAVGIEDASAQFIG